MRPSSRSRPPVDVPSRFPPGAILLSVGWNLGFGLSYRDLEELLVERGIDVDHITLYRWVQRFTPLLNDAARPRRHPAGDRWGGEQRRIALTFDVLAELALENASQVRRQGDVSLARLASEQVPWDSK
jgi:hypothetical protein